MSAATVTGFEGVFWRPSAPATPPLRVAHEPTENRRLAAIVLAAICALALLFTATPTASSVNLFGSETRVAAQTDLTATGVGFGGSETSAIVGGNGPYAYDGVLGCCVAPSGTPGIKTPYGVAEQGTDAGSIALRGQVESGGTVYRQGVTGTQQTAEGQFWAGQNPALTPGYASSYGTPGTQVAPGEYPWIMGGTVEPGVPFVTRGAPGIGTNLGGAPEVVVNPGGVRNLWFHMPD